jgi:hypothetical protein
MPKGECAHNLSMWGGVYLRVYLSIYLRIVDIYELIYVV